MERWPPAGGRESHPALQGEVCDDLDGLVEIKCLVRVLEDTDAKIPQVPVEDEDSVGGFELSC